MAVALGQLAAIGSSGQGIIDEFGATGLREMAPGDVFVIETPGWRVWQSQSKAAE